MPVPKASIVMAVYNGASDLGGSIQSILNQSYRDFEFIIVDDGSIDNTWAILCDFASQDPRIVLLRNETNLGLARTLNRGLELTKGRLITRQDADDVSLPERLARQVEFLDTHPDYGLVSVAAQLVDLNGLPIKIAYNPNGNEEIQRILLDYMCICGAAIMVRRECLDQIGFRYSETLNITEDYDLVLRLAEVTKLEVLQDPLYIYKQNPESIVHTKGQVVEFNRATALEWAIFRRFGPNPSADKFALVGRDYLRAAIIGIAHKDLDAARLSLKRALELYPSLLESDQPLENLVRAYTPLESVDLALQYTETIFDELLPKTRRLDHMKSRLLSYLHMSEIFAAAKQNEYWRVKPHLLPGIRYDPAWLFNRGVISIFLKSLLSQVASNAKQSE
jgi:glycosyltransferase involved in cell wall biosynthesis